MTELPTILEDERKIKSLYFNDTEGTCVILGSNNVTKIVAYGEPGQHCHLPWFAVYINKEINSRIPAGQVEVCYEDSQ